MSVEELKVRFARLTEPVVATEDPYGRLLRRARRSRRARLVGWVSGLAAVVAAAVLTPLLVPASGSPSPAPSPGVDDLRGADITNWVRQLIDTPARGSLARDTAFTTAVTDGLAPRYFGFSPELDQRTVLFAGDVGSYRAVLIAFHSPTRQMGVWLVGDAGASAAQLAAAGPANLAMLHGSSGTPQAGGAGQVKVMVEELQPYTATAVGGAGVGRYLAVGVAPEGCRLATKDARHPRTWHDETTGDYVVRTDPLAVDVSTYAQVTCEGVVRFAAPITNNARIEVAPTAPTDRQVDAAMAGTRGTRPDRDAVRRTMADLAAGPGQGQPPSFDGCKVLYNGPVPGAVDSSPVPGGTVREPPLLVVACPTGHGNTQFYVGVDGGGAGGGYTRAKLGDPRAIFAVRGLVLRDTTTTRSDGTTTHGGSSIPDDRVLVLAPPSATLLQVVQGGQVTQSVPLAAGIGSITVPGNGTVQLRALDGSGAVVGSGAAPTGEDIPEERPAVTDPPIDNWK
jgi:hypothetical protein